MGTATVEVSPLLLSMFWMNPNATPALRMMVRAVGAPQRQISMRLKVRNIGFISFPGIIWDGVCVKNHKDNYAIPYNAEINMLTEALCKSFCLNVNKLYFGVQFGRQCHCGNEQPSFQHLLPSSECNMTCEGNSSQMCGGAYRATVFKIQGKP